VPTGYISWLDDVLTETKKLVKTIGDIPKWCDIEKYSEAIEALKTKKESDEIWVNTTEITDEIRDEYFIDYGYANSWGQDDKDKFRIAYRLHNRDSKDHPELHNTQRKQNARSDETIYCSCGFKHSADSSD
jgi:hypothetical protein